ncbi:MAG: glycosyltransferase family 39 protein, partial [Acidobacteriota bacterium]|nr:glycosyltransferase family 39 protein [Acidobacteriota bacterium]
MESSNPSPQAKNSSRAREALLLAAALMIGLLLRLGTWPQVFFAGRVWIDGPDGYYHLRRAWLTLRNWPWTPQVDMLIGVPGDGPISWPPVFDLLLATLALPWKGEDPAILEPLGAALPPLLGLIEIGCLYWVVRRLFSARAAAWAAVFAAVLPGVSRYSLLGALDHDALVEIFTLVAIAGLVRDLQRPQGRRVGRSAVALVGGGVTLLVLTWAGSILHVGLLCAIVFLVEVVPASSDGRWKMPDAGPAFAAGWGFLVAAAATLPFVLRSVWTREMGATFIGLSWLHTAVLLVAACGALSLVIGKRWLEQRGGARGGDMSSAGGEARWALVLLFGAGLLLLAGSSSVLPAFRQGLSFLGRGEPFVRVIMESRPLLSLFGEVDGRAALVRLSLLPLLVPIALPWMIRRTAGDRRVVLLGTWALFTLALALIQSRYAHAAALPIAAIAGVGASNALALWSRRQRLWGAVAVCVLVLVPSIPAYVSTPGFEPFRFYGRVPRLLTTGMSEVCDYLRRVEPSTAWADPGRPSQSAVQAPWSFGHWLIWLGRQGTVTTPLGPLGQPAFADGIRYYFLQEADAREVLRRHRVRYIVATAEVPQLDAWAQLAGIDARDFFATDPTSGRSTLLAEKYL